MKPAKILFFDLENFPARGYFWPPMYQTNVIKLDRAPIICCFSAKWLGGKQITKGLPDYKGYKPGREDSTALIKDIWNLFDEAEIIIAQNGDNFDIKMMNTEFIKHGLKPPSPYKTVDTLKTARRVFRFPSNKLDDLGEALEEGKKIPTDKELWFGCMAGDRGAWKKMRAYNAQDVLLLEKVYLRFLPWVKNHPSVAVGYGPGICPNCRSSFITKQGMKCNKTTCYQAYRCSNCGSWFRDTQNTIARADRPYVSI